MAGASSITQVVELNIFYLNITLLKLLSMLSKTNVPALICFFFNTILFHCTSMPLWYWVLHSVAYNTHVSPVLTMRVLVILGHVSRKILDSVWNSYLSFPKSIFAFQKVATFVKIIKASKVLIILTIVSVYSYLFLLLMWQMEKEIVCRLLLNTNGMAFLVPINQFDVLDKMPLIW